jgi:5-methylcytosine-specific restriction protein A
MRKAWHKLYTSSRWANPRHGLRWRTLVRDNFTCQHCGRVEHASRLHGHHRVAHQGDPQLFWNEANVVTLCENCHNATTAEENRDTARGYSDACDADGYALDPAHPSNRARPV